MAALMGVFHDLGPIQKGKGRGGILSFLRFRANGLRQPAISGLLSSTDFERALLRERARSDRTGSHFLLLVLKVVHSDTQRERDEGTMHNLAQTVRERCRISDLAGWYRAENEQIGLILPATPPEAAHSLVLAIEAIFHDRTRRRTPPDRPLPEIACEVFTYPSDRDAQNLGRTARAPAPVQHDPGIASPMDLSS